MEFVILSFLILLNGFFALSEIALVSSKKSRLNDLRLRGIKGADTALRLLDDSESFLSAIQVGITLIGIVTGVYGGINLAEDVEPMFLRIELTRPFADVISLTLTVLIITYFSIVIGELVPKTVALNNPERIAVMISRPIKVFSVTFFPFVKLLSSSTNFINRLLGVTKGNDQINERELRQMIKLASTEGIIEKDQNVIHEKVFYFSDKRARHIMTHRTEVEWIDIDRHKDWIMGRLNDAQHSQVVCCSGDPDNFVGTIFLKDYFRSLSMGAISTIKDLIVEPFIVPESAYAKSVLQLFQSRKVHLCFVVNEYGGFEGIITLHDIIESFLGQIPQSDEDLDSDVVVRDDNSFLVSGDAPVESLTEIIEGFTIDLDEVEYSTVAGFVFNAMDRVPKVGESFVYQGYTVEVVDIDGNRIDKVLIYKTKK